MVLVNLVQFCMICAIISTECPCVAGSQPICRGQWGWVFFLFCNLERPSSIYLINLSSSALVRSSSRRHNKLFEKL